MSDLAAKMDGCGKAEQSERRSDVIEHLHYCDTLSVFPTDGLKAISKKMK